MVCCVLFHIWFSACLLCALFIYLLQYIISRFNKSTIVVVFLLSLPVGLDRFSQDDMWVLAMQSVFEESLPRPSVDTVRGEMFPSAWILQRSQRQGREVVTVLYLLQVTFQSSPPISKQFSFGLYSKPCVSLYRLIWEVQRCLRDL